jgi:hypothetical protein
MSGRYYDGDGHSPSHHIVREAARNKGHPQHRDYERVSRSTDHVPRPRISSTDYMPPSRQDHSPPPERSTFRYSSPGSDYIDRPEDSRSDYIDAGTPASCRYGTSRAVYDDRYDGGFSRSRSPATSDMSRHRDNRSDIDYSPPREEKSNYQLLKEGGWGTKRDFMRSHGLKTWKPDDYQKANEMLDKYREVDAQREYASANEYRKRAGSVEGDRSYRRRGSDYEEREFEERAFGKRAGSVESDIVYHRHGSDYEDREFDERASDIASYHSGARSGRLSRASTAAGSGVASPHLGRRGSDYAKVPASSHGHSPSRSICSGSERSLRDYATIFASDREHSPSRIIRSGSERSLRSRSATNLSDYATVPVSNRERSRSRSVRHGSEQSLRSRSATHSSDDNGIAEGSDYMSSDDAQSDICRKPGSHGYASDDNRVAEGSDYVSSDDGMSDVCSNPGSDGGSGGSGDEDDYMSDDREDCIEDDDD